MTLLKDFVERQGAADALDACQKVVEKHFGRELHTPGTNLDLIIRGKGINLQRSGKCTFEGMIERDEHGTATIVLRGGLSQRRERFTLAHELGHWLLQEELIGTMSGRLFRGVSKDHVEVKDEEYLASLLAAEILMPFHHIRSSFQQQRPLVSLLCICREYRVSRTAAVRRIADVFNVNLLLLQIVPYQSDLDSAATVDDAIYATARSATLFDRQRTKFVDQLRYSDLMRRDHPQLSLMTPKGNISAHFEIDSRNAPIPHAFALACVESWK